MGFTLATVGGRVTATMYNEHAEGVRYYKEASTAARDLLTDMSVGDLCFVTANLITYRYNGTTWVPWSSPWISFTPTLTAGTGSWAVGTGGFNVSEYKYTDGEYRQRGRIVFGSSGFTVFTSQPRVSLASGVALRAPVVANESLEGDATLFDTGVAVNRGYIRYNGTLTDRIEIVQNAATAAGSAVITSTSPWTWAATDAIEYSFTGKLA